MIIEHDSEEEMEDCFETILEIQILERDLKHRVSELELEFKQAQDELLEFQQEYKEELKS